MKRYEMMVISDTEVSEEDRRRLFDRMGEIIAQKGGRLVEFDDWGVRKLAYEIKKKHRGAYMRVDFCGEGPLVSELERFCKIDDRVMKFMTVLIHAKADPDAAIAEAAAKRATKAPVEDAGAPKTTAETAAQPADSNQEAEAESTVDEKQEESDEL